MTKELRDVGTWQAVIQEREGCCMVGNDRGDDTSADPYGNSFHDFLCQGDVSRAWIRT